MNWQIPGAALVHSLPDGPVVLAVEQGPGPGLWLQIFVLVSLVGLVLTAWLVLRGYGKNDDQG
jgi:hypothetical protein